MIEEKINDVDIEKKSDTIPAIIIPIPIPKSSVAKKVELAVPLFSMLII